MKIFEFIEKIAYFHSLIMNECTGTAEKFAEKLNVSRATIYNIIEEMKSFNIEIGYSRTRETYYYKHPHRVKITISIQQDEKKKNKLFIFSICLNFQTN